MFAFKKVKETTKVNTVKGVSTLFNNQLINMTCTYDKIVFAFDIYKPDSLKKKKNKQTNQQKQETKDSKVNVTSDIKLVTTQTAIIFL